MPKITEELDAMIKSYENFDTSEGDDQSTDPPSTESSSTESPATAAPEDNKSTEAPSTEAPADSPDYESKIRDLEEKIEQLTKKPSTKAPSTDAPVDELDFLGDEEVDDLLSDKKSLNALLNKVFLKGAEMTKKQMLKNRHEILQSLPTMVKTNIVTLESVRKASEDFYKNNPDLEPFRKTVATMFEEVATEHPDWTHEKLLKASEKMTREKLGIEKKANPQPEPKPKSPPLPRKRSQHRQTNNPEPSDPMLAEIEAMEKSLWR
jgi:hypothetical protein